MADGNITVEVRTQAAQAEHDWASHGADAFGLMAVAYEPPRSTVGYEGGLQEVNLGDLLHFARTLEQRHGIGPNAKLTGPQRPRRTTDE